VTYVKWSTMYHLVWDERRMEVTWCGRKIPANAERSATAPRTLVCAVCLASEEA